MHEHAINMLGLVAGTLTTAAFVPQVLKTWRSRAARDVSLAMFLILALGAALWTVYGLLIHSTPVLVANGVTLLLVLTMLALKWRFR
jgi:MtN3 and saliva related transmembrane protein